MSAPKNAEVTVDEMDLMDIFSLFKRWFYNLLALCFKAIDFIFKFWWIVLILIVLGVIVGKFSKGDPKYKATLIVKTNFDSQPYVYNAVEQFDAKIAEKDSLFILKNELDIEKPEIGGTQITPIVDVVALLEGIGNSDSRSLSSVLKELSVDGDEELFASDRFYSNYEYHKLEVYLRVGQGEQFVNRILTYINEQPQILKIKEGVITNLEERITANKKMLIQVDTLINGYARNINTVNRNAERLAFYNNQNNLNINAALTLKNTLITETEELKNERITYTDAVVVLSDVQIIEDKGISDKKHLIYPMILISLFLVAAAIRYAYKTIRAQLVEEQLLD